MMRIKVIRQWFLDLPMITKMFILFAMAGLIPLISSFAIFYKEIFQFTLSNREYMVKQGYNQTNTALTDQLNRIYNLSTIIVGNEELNRSLKSIKDDNDILTQYIEYKKISNDFSNKYYSTEYNSIEYYIDGKFNTNKGVFPLFLSSDTQSGKNIAKSISENDNKPVWMRYDDNNIYNSGKYLSLARYVIDMSDYSKNIGMIMVNIDLSKIRNLFIISMPSQLVYLESENGQIITSSNENILKNISISQKIENQIKSKFGEVNIQGKRYLACSKSIENTNLKLVSVVPMDAISKTLNYYNTNIAILYFFICIIMLVIIYAISKSISKRIVLLSKQMEGVKSGKFKKLEIKTQKDEVGDLIGNYNYMIDEMKSLLYLQFELGQQKKGAELKALQSQINPHFLYNTLDMINWMAQKNESENIQEIVYSLSKYYRLILNKGEDIIKIGDEIELCKAYINIQQKRFKGKIEFIIDVEDNIKKYLIPKITLQPLIENAILHGIVESKKGLGKVIVSGWEDDEDIILSVTDDGIGMKDRKDWDEDIESKHRNGSGYGIKNIEMRLTMFYGIPKCINYDSIEGMGTCVSLNIKKKEKDIDVAK